MSLIKLLSDKTRSLVIFFIDLYRNHLSLLMLPRCRFYPSCSSYAREAFSKKGLALAAALTIRRLLKCHPFNHSCFYDPLN